MICVLYVVDRAVAISVAVRAHEFTWEFTMVSIIASFE